MARFLFFCSLGAACSGTGEGDSGWSSQEIALHSPIIRMMTFHNINSYLKYYSRVLQFLHQCAMCIFSYSLIRNIQEGFILTPSPR